MQSRWVLVSIVVATFLLALSAGRAGAQTVTEFSAGISALAFPRDITSGPDGALWFAEGGGNRIGRITSSPVLPPAPALGNSGPLICALLLAGAGCRAARSWRAMV
jgi:virginiamycin B lyase